MTEEDRRTLSHDVPLALIWQRGRYEADVVVNCDYNPDGTPARPPFFMGVVKFVPEDGTAPQFVTTVYPVYPCASSGAKTRAKKKARERAQRMQDYFEKVPGRQEIGFWMRTRAKLRPTEEFLTTGKDTFIPSGTPRPWSAYPDVADMLYDRLESGDLSEEEKRMAGFA